MVDLMQERFQTGRGQDRDHDMRDLQALVLQLESIIEELKTRIQALEDA